MAEAMGYRGEATRNGHFRWIHPEVPNPIFTPGMPRVRSGHKELQKLRTALARAREAKEATS